ncbi:MAG: hypothetical protein HOV81_26555 [Kofleriaceae bacterium]|nr:hypothetical protein [Kofleriaceae bacterium]
MRTSTKSNIRSAVADWNWGAIAAGVVIALATQILLLWLGHAFAVSVGDKRPGGVFSAWVIVVQLGSLFLGSAFAGYLARSTYNLAGAAVGAFTWALALVLGGTLASEPLAGWRPAGAAAAAWTTFIGAIVSLVSAMAGGAFGSQRRRNYDEQFPTAGLTGGGIVREERGVIHEPLTH